jgi:hypothetical protein
MVYEHRSGETLTGYPAMVLKDNQGEYRKQLEALYLLTCDEDVTIAKDLKAEQRQMQHEAGRFAGDVRWFTRQRKARQFLGLDKFLDPEVWWNPIDFANLTQKAKKYSSRTKDALNITVSNMTAGQIFGELIRQIGLDLEKKWATETSSTGLRYKQRRIDSTSWHYAQMYIKYRQSLAQQSVSSSLTICDRPPITFSSEPHRGGDQYQNRTQQETEVVTKSDLVAEEIIPRATATQHEPESTALHKKPRQVPEKQSAAASAATPDVLLQDTRERNVIWGVGLLPPGSVVECLGRVGTWVVRYCTSVVAKISDRYGQEEIASCKHLRLAG